MGSVNTQSVCEESERIKAEFQRITSNKKIDAEISMLFQSMLMLISLLIAIFLEKATRKNNKNSSKPSSQTEKDESFMTTTVTDSKGQQELEDIANNTRILETVTKSPVTQCDICGQDLRNAPCKHIERRTRIDIVFEKVVEHADAEVKYCNNCDFDKPALVIT
jgi:transposase